MTRTDTASRVIPAPVEHVYAALIDPDALAAWLPPGGMSGRIERFDARPGGSYRMILTYADASAAPGKATVDSVSDDPAYGGTMTMTWEVSTVDGGTRVEIRAEDVPEGIRAEDHAAGLASSLANLAAYVEHALDQPPTDESPA